MVRDSWGKKLISITDEAVMCKNQVGTVSTVPAGRSAEQSVVKSAVAAAEVNTCEKEGSDKGKQTAESLSVTLKSDVGMEYQIHGNTGNYQEQLANAKSD